MLTITVPSDEFFDEGKQRFIYSDPTILELEHSLVSLSKWEQKFEKPFLDPRDKTSEEVLWYIKAMTTNGDFPLRTYYRLSEENLEQINEYINKKMTATWFTERPGAKGGREVITAELVYYWMASMSIPYECQFWHLNRLFTLIKVASEKNTPQKKMSKSELLRQQREINQKRRAQFGSSG